MTIVLSEDCVNLSQPAIKSGSQTLAEMHAPQCPPCHGRCHQGRQCNAQAASACSELLEDAEAERRMTVRGRFWATYFGALLAAVCAGIAHFMPALKTLVNF